MAVWASLVNCISSCQLLKARHCSLSPNGCFAPPSAPHLPPPPTPSPHTHPLSIDSIRDITGTEENHLKTSNIQIASKISYEMIAIIIITALYLCKISGLTVLNHQRGGQLHTRSSKLAVLVGSMD